MKCINDYIFKIVQGIIQFSILNFIICFILIMVSWYKRDNVPASIIGLNNLHSFFNDFMFFSFYGISLVCYIVVLIFNMIKSLEINKNIFLQFILIKYLVLSFFMIVSFNGWDSICPWNPVIDTKYSDTFNIHNLNMIEIGMTKEHVISLIGDPLRIIKNENVAEILKYTDDNKGNKIIENQFIFAYFAWINIELEFQENILSRTIIEIMND